MTRAKLSIIILLIISLSFAACNGEASHPIPAVVQDGGGLVGVTIKAVPGEGEIYLSTFPNTGVATQKSVDDAVIYVASKLGKSLDDCNILVSIDGNIAEYVDGPSAGVAFSVLTYAAIEGEHVRDDATVTGAVDRFGKVGRVGGLYEKASALSKNHIKYFLTPQHSLHERVILSHIQRTSDLEIIEVENVDEAIGFMVFNREVEKKPLTIPDRSLKNIESYDASDLDKFKEITLELIEGERKVVNNIKDDEREVKEIKDVFLVELERQNALIEKGYLFTAANEAFLDYIDASTIVDVENPDIVDLNKKVNSINKCLNSLQTAKKTDKNFEWLIGADLRKSWATQRIGATDVSAAQLAEEKYFIYNQLMYADAWCVISSLLVKTGLSIEQGEQIDETSWKHMAQKKLLELEKLNITNEDILDHIDSAKISFKAGNYGAAAFDATFAESMYASDNAINSASSELLVTSTVNRLKNEKRSSLWGKIYQSQAVFISRTGDNAGAYRLLKYADDLDKLVTELHDSAKLIKLSPDSTSSNKKTDVQPPPALPQTSASSKLQPENVNCLPGFIFVFTIGLVYIRRK
ncbi:hypothetical protein J4450_05825 [Candidatus Micrarchaeota archaeon]|nr:hypothetical protein [Candidatus Micrarchaeota archaeon]